MTTDIDTSLLMDENYRQKEVPIVQ